LKHFKVNCKYNPLKIICTLGQGSLSQWYNSSRGNNYNWCSNKFLQDSPKDWLALYMCWVVFISLFDPENILQCGKADSDNSTLQIRNLRLTGKGGKG
jgi:hypothetical protein